VDAQAIPDVLARICADTRAETARRRAVQDETALQAAAEAAGPARGFADALGRAAQDGYALIAEMKRVSPSGGAIRPQFDPGALARAYADGGAACLSVLTDGPHFGGSLDDLRAARACAALPALRKDFTLDAWQVLESRAAGADCVLLIMACLTDGEAAALERDALALGMAVLAEAHDRAELDRALRLRTPLIGVNNRDLRTLATSLATTEALAPHVPPDRLLVAESGIRTHADVRRLADAGARCFLVGESLLRQDDLVLATRALLGRDG
jgi:indole-3-glycerol phosphate synthase